MIIAPDFFEHWKTKALIELTKRPESPLWVQRLWAHCQTRKAWEFRDLSALALKSICGVTADITPEAWKIALLEARFVREAGKKLIVHDWDEHNSQLIARWESGSRPKKKRRTSDGQATDNQPASDREDRRDRIEKKGGSGANAPQTPVLADIVAYATTISLSVDEAAKFFDHFTSNGWRQAGGNRIRDWKAALRNWARRAVGYAGKNRDGGMGAAPIDLTKPHAHTGGLEVFESELPPAPEVLT